MDYLRIIKDGIHLGLGKGLTVIIGLLNLILLSRLLSTEDMGVYALSMMIINLVLLVGLNWSDSSLVRHGREEFVKRGKVNLSFWARMYLFIPVVIISIGAIIFFSPEINNYLGSEIALSNVILLAVILNSIANLMMYLFQSINKVKISAYIFTIQKFALLLLFGAAFYIGIDSNIWLVLTLINISFLATILVNLLFVDFSTILPYKFNRSYLKKIWSYSWPHILGFPGVFIINAIDLIVIKKYLTLQDVGTYSIAYNAFTNILGFIMIIYTAAFPIIVEYRTKRETSKISKYVKHIPIFTIAYAIMAILLILASAPLITLMFSTKYAASTPSFQILLVSSIFYFITVCLLPVLNAYDQMIQVQLTNLIVAGVNIIADFALVPKFGIAGAAYGTVLAYMTGAIFNTATLINLKKKNKW